MHKKLLDILVQASLNATAKAFDKSPKKSKKSGTVEKVEAILHMFEAYAPMVAEVVTVILGENVSAPAKPSAPYPFMCGVVQLSNPNTSNYTNGEPIVCLEFGGGDNCGVVQLSNPNTSNYTNGEPIVCLEIGGGDNFIRMDGTLGNHLSKDRHNVRPATREELVKFFTAPGVARSPKLERMVAIFDLLDASKKEEKS